MQTDTEVYLDIVRASLPQGQNNIETVIRALEQINEALKTLDFAQRDDDVVKALASIVNKEPNKRNDLENILVNTIIVNAQEYAIDEGYENFKNMIAHVWPRIVPVVYKMYRHPFSLHEIILSNALKNLKG